MKNHTQNNTENHQPFIIIRNQRHPNAARTVLKTLQINLNNNT